MRRMGPRKRGGAANTIIIPADLVEEILHRLPSNDLLNFKLVSKEWQRLISSPEFIQKHLERSKAKSHHPHIVKFKISPSEIEILTYCGANNITSKKIRMSGRVRLLGSCDGLVLYYKFDVGEIGALNPSTGEVAVNARLINISDHLQLIFTQSGHSICTWFGRHPATGEYVFVSACVDYPKFIRESISIVFRVYGLSRNSLFSSLTKEVDSRSFFGYPYIGTFLHGRLHVLKLSSKGDEILAYDLRTNRLVRMLAPLAEHRLVLGVVDGYLCALDKSQVWMMKEYGVEGSWTKYANIDDKLLIPIQICPNADVVLCDEFLKAFEDGGYGFFMRRKAIGTKE